jgi:hypothetical protein
MFLQFEHYDFAISEVSHYQSLRGHSSISYLKDAMVGFKKIKIKIKIKSLI